MAKKEIGKNLRPFAGGVVPCALGAACWLPRGGLSSSSGLVVVFFFFCGGVLLCVLVVLLLLVFSVLGGAVSLLCGCACLGSLLALVLVLSAPCLLSARGGRRWCLALRCLPGLFFRFLLRLRSGGGLLARGCCGRAGLVLVLVFAWLIRWRCRSRRCCLLAGGLAFSVCFGVVVVRCGRLGGRRGRLRCGGRLRLAVEASAWFWGRAAWGRSSFFYASEQFRAPAKIRKRTRWRT